jgi:putative hemolysin
MELSRDNPFAGIARVCRLQVDGDGELPRGALVVVANHPTGPMDGISYGSWLLERRPDALILTNGALAQIPLFKGKVIGLSLYDDARAARLNALALKRVMKHLSQGGCVAAFPAGTIGWRRADGRVRDPEWMPTVFELALRTKAQVACVKIKARNGWILERLLAVHAMVRTFLLGWSFLAACGGKHELRLCGVIEPNEGKQARQVVDEARRLVES